MKETLMSILVLGLIVSIPMLLERFFPFRKIPLFRKGFLSDIGWYFQVQEQLLNLFLINYFNQFALAHHFNIITGLPFWQQCVIVFFVFDFSTYWVHRGLHEGRLWRFHELHHSSIDLDWLSATRNHVVDSFFGSTVTALTFCFLGGDFKVAETVAAIITIHGIYKHANIRHKTGWLQYVIISAEMHRLHHLNDERFYKSNFGTMLSVWDLLFGTFVYPREEDYRDIPFGTDRYYPQNFISGNIYVFRKKKKTTK